MQRQILLVTAGILLSVLHVSSGPVDSIQSNPAQTIASDEESGEGEDTPEVDYAAVSPDYFTTMGIPLIRGGTFSPAGGGGTTRIVCRCSMPGL